MQVAKELEEKKNLPLLTGRQIAFMICAFFEINNVHGRAMSMNDLLNIEVVNDILKKFDQAWEETLMALEKEPEADLVEDLHQRQLEKSTLMQNAFVY